MPSTKITRIFGAPTTPGKRPSTDNLAEYNSTIEEMLPNNLSEKLQSVVAYIFPLGADADLMQSFLDRYLNFPDGRGLDGAPPVYFKPAAPFVLLEVANYGRVSSNIVNAGWFSQREIAFGMAVEWYARKGNDLRFLKYALIYPYVYVDSPLGIAGGREIYGWSKAPIEVALLRKRKEDAVPVPLAPVFDPPTEQLLLAANLLNPGQKPHEARRREKLMEISQSRYLQTATSAVADALTAVPRAIGASLNVGWEALKFILESREYAASQVGNLSKMLPQYRGMVTKYLPSWVTQTSGYRTDDDQPVSSATSIITLKQVREIEDGKGGDRNRACYQGILESQMRIKSISDGGSLVDLTNPDPSAGMYVDLFAYSGKKPGPLELGVNYQVVGGEPSSPGGGKNEPDASSGTASPRYRVIPFLPFWVKMDLQYGLADYQTWRTTWTDWTETNTPKIQGKQLIKYVDLGAGARQEIPAPTNFPHVTMRILPLAAQKLTIQQILSSYLYNYNPRHQDSQPKSYFDFSPVLFPNGSCAEGYAMVLAILSNFEGMETAGNNTTYDDYEFAFAIPMCWTDNTNQKSGHGLVSAYTFAGTEWNAITTGEVYGRWTLESTFISAPFPYTLPPGKEVVPGLKINTQFFPDKNPSEEVLDLPVVEVAAPYAGLFKIDGPGESPIDQEVISWLQKIGLPHFAITSPQDDSTKHRFYGVALKQVRDANDPQKADCQASVWLERNFIVKRAKWLNAEMELRIPKYETVSIADTLGLTRGGYSRPRNDPWPHAKKVYLVKPVRRSGNLSGSVVVTGRMQATSADIGWWRIGKEGWKGREFKPGG